MGVISGKHLAFIARSKLDKEAQRSEHILRRLVAHANLLDTLLDNTEHFSIQSEPHSRLQPQLSELKRVIVEITEIRATIDVGDQSAEETSSDSSEDSDEEGNRTENDDEEIELSHILVRSRTSLPRIDNYQIIDNKELLEAREISTILYSIDGDIAATVNDEESTESKPEDAKPLPSLVPRAHGRSSTGLVVVETKDQ